MTNRIHPTAVIGPQVTMGTGNVIGPYCVLQGPVTLGDDNYLSSHVSVGGSAEVYGKQSTSWVASYTDDYAVVMMVSQGGTGSGTSGPAVRAIYEALYGVDGSAVDASRAAIPGVVAPVDLPVFRRDGSILPPRSRRSR